MLLNVSTKIHTYITVRYHCYDDSVATQGRRLGCHVDCAKLSVRRVVLLSSAATLVHTACDNSHLSMYCNADAFDSKKAAVVMGSAARCRQGIKSLLWQSLYAFLVLCIPDLFYRATPSLGKARHATPEQTSSGRQSDGSLFAVEWKTAVLASALYLTSQEERSANRSSTTVRVGISSCEAHSES